MYRLDNDENLTTLQHLARLRVALYDAMQTNPSTQPYVWYGLTEEAYEHRNERIMDAVYHAHEAGLPCGSGWDDDAPEGLRLVVLIDLPGAGQISYHVPEKHGADFHCNDIPAYPGEWDGTTLSWARTTQYCFQTDDVYGA